VDSLNLIWARRRETKQQGQDRDIKEDPRDGRNEGRGDGKLHEC